MQVSHQTLTRGPHKSADAVGRLIDHFQRYKSTDVVYVSGDQFFLTHAAALSYGNGEVKTVRRSDLAQPVPAEPAHTPLQDTLTAEQIEAMTYEQLKAASAALNLITEDNKKTTIKQALLAFINQ